MREECECDIYIVLAWDGDRDPEAQPFESEEEAREWCEHDSHHSRYEIQRHTLIIRDNEDLMSLGEAMEFAQGEDDEAKVWVEWALYHDLDGYENRVKLRRFLREYLHMYNIKWRVWRRKPDEETARITRWRWEA